MQRKRRRRLERAGHLRHPGDRPRPYRAERAAGSDERRPTIGALPRVPARAPAHEEPEQPILGWTRQKLIDERLAMAQGKESTGRKKLRAQAASRFELDESETLRIRDRDDV